MTDLQKAENLTEAQSPAREAVASAASSVMALTTLDDEKSPAIRFANNLAVALTLRADADSLPATGKVYFVYTERPNKYAKTAGATAFIDLDTDPALALADRLMLVSETANGGVYFDVANQAEVFKKIAELNLDTASSATFSFQTSQVRVYTHGFQEPQTQYAIGLRKPKNAITAADIKDVIDEFHAECLCTPQLTAPVFWKEQSTWLPEGSAEKNIQWPLKAALVLAFREAAVVKAEEVNALGDSDFVLYSRADLIGSPPVAVVEVKVQKTAREGGPVEPSETRREYVRGLIQTAAYRNKTGAKFAILACFDLRKPGAGTESAWASATKRAQTTFNGLMRRKGGAPAVLSWLVFADTQAAQAAQAAGDLWTDDEMYPVRQRPDHKADLGG